MNIHIETRVNGIDMTDYIATTQATPPAIFIVLNTDTTAHKQMDIILRKNIFLTGGERLLNKNGQA